VIFASDHPVTKHGVSAYPAEVTAAMLACLANGGAAASVLAKQLSIPLRVIDVGVAKPPTGLPALTSEPRLERAQVAELVRGDLRVEDALSSSAFESLLRTGSNWAEARPELAVAVIGEIGIGNTTAAASVAAALLGCDAKEIVGAGTGVTGVALSRKQQVVADALARVGPCSAEAALRRLGGADLAAMTGAMLGYARGRTAVLVDGFIASVAALAASRIEPELCSRLIFAHRSAEQGHARILAALDADPLLDLGLRLGEASGALIAFPLLELACALHDRMSTFEESSVPNRSNGGSNIGSNAGSKTGGDTDSESNS